MAKIADVNDKIAEKVVGGYKKIEDAVVGGYKKIENGFVDTFLAHEGESVEEAKQRMAAQADQRKTEAEQRLAEQQAKLDALHK